MTAARPRPFTLGATSERLAQYILGNMSFVTPVPYPEDVGHDLQCVLHVAVDGDRKLVHSGPAFTVQVKSRKTDLVYQKDHERKWIGEQFDPFLVCVVSRAKPSCEIYSTWNVLNGVLMHGTGKHPGKRNTISKTTKVVLKMGALEHDGQAGVAVPEPERAHPYGGWSMSGDGTLTIPLGPPILSLRPVDVTDIEKAKHWAGVLRGWIELDRANLVRVRNGMYWVYGPKHWETNQPAWSAGDLHNALYSNAVNFSPDDENPHHPTVVENFWHSAEALRRVLQHFHPNDQPLSAGQIAALQTVLTLFEPYRSTMAARLLSARDAEDAPQAQQP